MKVMDLDRSERGPQRRRTSDGRLLHCCCICGTLAPWSNSWVGFYSWQEVDDGKPLAKFCLTECRQNGGINAANVTESMKHRARAAELREPEIVWREPTEAEKYQQAVRRQRPKTP